ncbi:MAG TPA: DUF6602 domain-containing protein [Steroidobacteraceae bacterium]|nr:DUF6602 domain-containing protein [Steroidobacteraceae bacterium]
MSTKYFEYITNRIAAAKRQADSLSSGIGHPGLAGEIRELATRECIEPFLTQSYSCGTGKVIDSRQILSDQIDLLVYHKKVVPPILISRDLGLFPVECVRYAFEIKSTLTAEDIRDANKKFRSIQRLVSFPKAQPDGGIRGGSLPTTVLFAFRSDISGAELDRYRKYTRDENPPCSVLCVLGKGYWFYHAQKKNWYGQDTPPPLPAHTEFAMFITGFMNTLASEETSLRPFRPGNYVNVDDIILNPIPAEPNTAG